MRKSLFFLLLASAAVPALAAPGDDPSNDSDRAARHEARSEARAEARSQRQAEPAQESPRAEPQAVRSNEPRSEDRPVVREQRQEVVRERVERSSEPNLGDSSARSGFQLRMTEQRSDQSLAAEPPRPALEQHRDTTDSVREWRRHERNVDNRAAAIEPRQDTTDSAREWRGRERRVGNVPVDIEVHNGTLGGGSFRELRREPTGRDAIGNRRGPVSGSVPQQGMRPPLPTNTRQSGANRLSSVTAQHWRNHWRSDHRYDWRNHRHRHRSLFHLGFYYDPFGWGYQRYSIGSRLWPNFYRSSYWLNDPWQYRLPYAPPGYRWIRYYDDAVLVDMWDGQVVDVIYNFFW